MSDWPISPVLPAGLTHITPFTIESIGSAGGGLGSLASATWGTNNLARYIPFRISQALQVANAFTLNGSAVSGNIDLGIYDAAGTRLASTGSTAQAGTTAIQTIALSVLLGPGQYWMALACSASAATFLTATPSANTFKALGCYQQATAFALPATATFATYAASQIHSFGISAFAVV